MQGTDTLLRGRSQAVGGCSPCSGERLIYNSCVGGGGGCLWSDKKSSFYPGGIPQSDGGDSILTDSHRGNRNKVQMNEI